MCWEVGMGVIEAVTTRRFQKLKKIYLGEQKKVRATATTGRVAAGTAMTQRVHALNHVGLGRHYLSTQKWPSYLRIYRVGALLRLIPR